MRIFTSLVKIINDKNFILFLENKEINKCFDIIENMEKNIYYYYVKCYLYHLLNKKNDVVENIVLFFDFLNIIDINENVISEMISNVLRYINMTFTKKIKNEIIADYNAIKSAINIDMIIDTIKNKIDLSCNNFYIIFLYISNIYIFEDKFYYYFKLSTSNILKEYDDNDKLLDIIENDLIANSIDNKSNKFKEYMIILLRLLRNYYMFIIDSNIYITRLFKIILKYNSINKIDNRNIINDILITTDNTILTCDEIFNDTQYVKEIHMDKNIYDNLFVCLKHNYETNEIHKQVAKIINNNISDIEIINLYNILNVLNEDKIIMQNEKIISYKNNIICDKLKNISKSEFKNDKINNLINGLFLNQIDNNNKLLNEINEIINNEKNNDAILMIYNFFINFYLTNLIYEIRYTNIKTYEKINFVLYLLKKMKIKEILSVDMNNKIDNNYINIDKDKLNNIHYILNEINTYIKITNDDSDINYYCGFILKYFYNDNHFSEKYIMKYINSNIYLLDNKINNICDFDKNVKLWGAISIMCNNYNYDKKKYGDIIKKCYDKIKNETNEEYAILYELYNNYYEKNTEQDKITCEKYKSLIEKIN